MSSAGDSIATACGGLILILRARAPKVRVMAHALITPCTAGKGSCLLPEHPPARVAIYQCGFAAPCGPWAAAAGAGAATSDAFDSPQRSEDYRDVFEKRAPMRSSPPDVGARKTRRRFSADYVLRGSPTQCRQPRDRKTRREVRRPTMFSEDRGRQPVICLSLYSAIWTGGGIGSGCRPDVWGADFRCRASTFVACAPSLAPSNRRKGHIQGWCLSDACSIPRIVTRVR